MDAKHILTLLQSRSFVEWYTKGDFDLYHCGDEDAPSMERILDQIKAMFTPPKKTFVLRSDAVKASKHVVVSGSPFYGGLKIHGPFDCQKDASTWIDRFTKLNLDTTTLVMLENPE